MNANQVYRIFDLFGNKADFSWTDEKKVRMYLKISDRYNRILEKKMG